MLILHVLVTVKVSAENIRFLSYEIGAHLSKSSGERFLPADFYTQRPSGDVPQGDHFEMEIIKPAVGDYHDYGIKHVHRASEGDKFFICYLLDVPTLDAAEAVVRMWCAGSAYTWLTTEDFGPEYDRDPDTFLDRMLNHGISVEIRRS